MTLPENGQLLRIYIGESDTSGGKALYEAILLKARELGLAGATALKGTMGFGASTRMHMAKLLELSEDLPVIVEIVDTAANIGKILPFLDETVTEGLVTLEDIKVLKYRHSARRR